MAPAAFGLYLAQPVKARAFVIGDSNIVFPAANVVQSSQQFPQAAPSPTVTVDYLAAVPGVGLRDLTQLLSRLNDAKIAPILAGYDAAIVNLGANDILQENANWNNFFAGTYPIGSGIAYKQRIANLLAAIPSNVRVYWIGVASGIDTKIRPEFHPFKISAVDLAIAGFDEAWGQFATPGFPTQARFKYVHADTALALIAPRFAADAVHYTPAAATALYDHVVGRIKADQP